MSHFAIVTPIADEKQFGHPKRIALNVEHIVSISPVYGNREAVAAVEAKPAVAATPGSPAVAATGSEPAVPAVEPTPKIAAVEARPARAAIVNGEIGSAIAYLSGSVRVAETIDEILSALDGGATKPAP